MTTKKMATKVARILRSFGLSWEDSHKWGRKLAQTYDFSYDFSEYQEEDIRDGVLSCLEMSEFPQWDTFFKTSAGEMGYSEAYQESYVTYDIKVKKTGEVFTFMRYI